MEEIMEKSISVIYGWCMKFSLDNGSQEEVNNKTGWEEYTPLGIHNTVVELFVVNLYMYQECSFWLLKTMFSGTATFVFKSYV